MKMRNVSDTFVEKIGTHMLSSVTFFFFRKSCAVHEIIRKNIAEPDRPQKTIGRIRIACWIPKTTNTHS